MNLKLKISPLLLILAFISNFPAQSQSSIEVVKSNLTEKLKKKLVDKSWSIKTESDEILIRFFETFFINTSISPINNRNGIYNKPDTITIRIKLKENWSQRKVDSIRQNNKMIIEPLKYRFISHYDSLNWRYVKLSHLMFLERPYAYLKNWQIFNESEKQAIKKVIILPDTIIEGIGIFVYSNYQPGVGMELEPSEINQKVIKAFQTFEEILGKRTLFKAEERY
ncbi:MAG: hypothetical protein NVV82_27835 [Sporocytophaga sp.]|nr:hypothetical protein [Sporocytophaga sp.]